MALPFAQMLPQVKAGNPSELVATLKAAHERWGPIVLASGLSADTQ